SGTTEKAPAEIAGIKPGDRVVSIDGKRITAWSEVQQAIRSNPGGTIEIVVDRDGRSMTFTPRLEACVRIADGKLECENPGEAGGEVIGFLGVSPDYEKVERSVPASFATAGARIGTGMKDSLIAFKNIFAPSTLGRLFKVAAGQEQRRPEDPATIVGIGQASGDLAKRGDFAGLFLLVAGFNVFVGVANLLPLPPLDGGHLAVLGYEKVSRRDVDMRKLLPITAMVLTVFSTLFLLLLYTDIVHPIGIPG
ncbi:MAG: site-2 protease family protein, partial [Actinomycetota bacterium]